IDWSGSSACRLRHGILTQIGRTLSSLSAAQRRRKSPFGRKHNFLRVISVHICEPHLGGHSGFRHRHEKATFLSLAIDSRPADFSTCARSISKTFRSRNENRQRESSAGL